MSTRTDGIIVFDCLRLNIQIVLHTLACLLINIYVLESPVI